MRYPTAEELQEKINRNSVSGSFFDVERKRARYTIHDTAMMFKRRGGGNAAFTTVTEVLLGIAFSKNLISPYPTLPPGPHGFLINPSWGVVQPSTHNQQRHR